MKLYRKIDNEGLFIEDIFLDTIEEGQEQFYIETPCPGGFYRPKWNGTEWIEGLTLEEIEEIKNQPRELTELEKLIQRQDTTENAILFLMDLGGMM